MLNVNPALYLVYSQLGKTVNPDSYQQEKGAVLHQR
jgi:hypothetical protein